MLIIERSIEQKFQTLAGGLRAKEQKEVKEQSLYIYMGKTFGMDGLCSATEEALMPRFEWLK